MPARASGRRAELGQHFLRDGALARRLVDLAGIGRRQRVLEIGPGRGALTRWLAECSGSLIGVEFDPGLCAELRRRFAAMPHVRVVQADFLAHPLPEGDYTVFANPPFGRTAEIVRRLTQAGSPPRDAHLILQLEAALELAGRPWGRETLASLCAKPDWQIEIQERIAPEAFVPPPRVACALVWLARRRRPLVTAGEAPLYRDFVSAAFGTRGTSVREGLRGLFTEPQLRRLARELRFDPRARPSQLSFEQWLALFRFFARSAAGDVRRRIRGARARRSARRGPSARRPPAALSAGRSSLRSRRGG